MKIELSILIPSRNEEWLSETLEDILKHKTDKTEIIVVLDGAPAVKPLPVHKDITIIRHFKSRGQRASTNDAARIAKGKYLMKTDAHTAWDDKFDEKLLQGFKDMGDNITQVPIMRNLHVFDWVCSKGHRRYQSPSGVCKKCGRETKKDFIWNPKLKPQSTSYRFDHELHFQYFNSFKKTDTYKAQEKTGYSETMSMQGSCFVMTAERFWSLKMSDEDFGSWGAQGTEVACKTWLSGGQCIVNHSTWYAHLFRTQGGDFSFPYKQDNSQVEQARIKSRKLFLDNTWEHQKLPLVWLIDKFSPVDGWEKGDGKEMLTKIKEHAKNFVVI